MAATKKPTIKSHIGLYVNEGHDVETAMQMKQAIESNGGIAGVQAFVCASQEKIEDLASIENISQMTNFEYVGEGILGWKAYNIGTVSLIPTQTLNRMKAPRLQVLDGTQNPGCVFKVVQPRQQTVTARLSFCQIQRPCSNNSYCRRCSRRGRGTYRGDRSTVIDRS